MERAALRPQSTAPGSWSSPLRVERSEGVVKCRSKLGRAATWRAGKSSPDPTHVVHRQRWLPDGLAADVVAATRMRRLDGRLISSVVVVTGPADPLAQIVQQASGSAGYVVVTLTLPDGATVSLAVSARTSSPVVSRK